MGSQLKKFSMLNCLVLLLIAINHNTIIIMEKHIDNICSIVNSRMSLLRWIKPFLNHHCILRFYNTYIHNLFIYCSSAWGSCFSCFSCLLSLLLCPQKRAARLLLNDDLSQPSESLFPNSNGFLFLTL